MLTNEFKKNLEKQHYKIIGDHSAVKTCTWTKNALRGKGDCYKHKFYGISSLNCMQMTTSLSCANRCSFCWRGYKAPVSCEWIWKVDSPKFILEKSLVEHYNLLTGFNGSEKTKKEIYKNSKNVKHVALSLTGEAIIYPKINELIELFGKKHISTFLVTNAQYPEQIKNLSSVTQLTLSLDAPDEKTLKEIDKPLFKDYWKRFNQSLENLAEKTHRKSVRLTILKGINDFGHFKYAKLIEKSNADFVLVKAYMYIGESRMRLKKENAPRHKDIVLFSKELIKFLPDYEIVSDEPESKVVLIAKKKFFFDGKWNTWIDFDKYFEIVNSGEIPLAEDYLKETPVVGLADLSKLDKPYI